MSVSESRAVNVLGATSPRGMGMFWAPAVQLLVAVATRREACRRILKFGVTGAHTITKNEDSSGKPSGARFEKGIW